MTRTIVIRRDYLHYIKKFNRFEKRHSNLAVHCSPAFEVKEGDIVIYLKSDAEHRLGDPVWRIARVQSVDVSEDGLARSAVLEYRNPSEKTFRTTRRSVRTVVVVHREDELDLYQILEQAAQHVPLSPDSDP